MRYVAFAWPTKRIPTLSSSAIILKMTISETDYRQTLYV